MKQVVIENFGATAIIAEAGADVQLEDVSIAHSSAIRSSSRRLTDASAFDPDACGGALRLVDGATANLSRSELRSNRARHGGALCLLNQSKVVIDRCTLVEENQAIDGGGAIYVSDSSVEVRGAQITHNYALYDGGGLALDGAANASLIGVLVANNSAGGDGGAVSVTGASIVTLSSVNMSDNTAAGDGGAISATSTSTVLITSATSATSNASSAPAFATTGDCVVTDECISSPNYPNDYGNSEACTITPQRSKIVLSVELRD